MNYSKILTAMIADEAFFRYPVEDFEYCQTNCALLGAKNRANDALTIEELEGYITLSNLLRDFRWACYWLTNN